MPSQQQVLQSVPLLTFSVYDLILLQGVENRVVVLGFGSLLHTFGTQNRQVRLNVIGEELKVNEHHQPLNLETAAFKQYGPNFPIEFSRVSMDGRLTLVVDSQHGVVLQSWCALHQSNDIHVVMENLRAREGCRLDHILYLFIYYEDVNKFH